VGPTGHAAFFKHSHVKRLLDEALDSASPLPTLASGGRSEKELCAWAQQHGAATVEQVVSRWVERFSHLGACLSDYGAMSRLENVKAGTPEERLAADILRLACHIGGARAVLRDDPSTGRGKDERWKAAQVSVKGCTELHEMLANLLVTHPDHFRDTMAAMRRIGDALAGELLGTGGTPVPSEEHQPPIAGADQVPEPVKPAAEGQVGGGQADKEADKPKKKLRTFPENSEVLKLARLIKNGRKERRPQVDVARGFTEGNEVKAQSLLRQLRRYPDLLD
jgi:hypothetical protein